MTGHGGVGSMLIAVSCDRHGAFFSSRIVLYCEHVLSFVLLPLGSSYINRLRSAVEHGGGKHMEYMSLRRPATLRIPRPGLRHGSRIDFGGGVDDV